MLLFDKSLHDGIEEGRVTLTFRNWEHPRVTVGKTYRAGDVGEITIEDLSRVRLSEVTEEEARSAGAQSLEDFRRQYAARNPKVDLEQHLTYRVRFRYIGNEAALVLAGRLGEDDLRRLDRQLAHIDVQSYEGDWTQFFISTLTQKRWMRPGELAQHLGTDQDMVRRKMGVLADLGIVRADPGLGYSLSDGGRKLYAYRMRG
jgi:hypothetical protein